MKTKGFQEQVEYERAASRKAISPTGYPTLSDVGEETFSCPVARLYLTALGTLSCTVAFREMTPEEMHEEMTRRAGEIDSASCGGGRCQ